MGREGLRAGWRLALYLIMGTAIFLLLALGLRVIAGRYARQPLWSELFAEIAVLAAALAAAWIMSRIEKRSVGVYGLPARSAFGKLFFAGAVWGLLGITALLLIMRGIGVFSFGGLALHGLRIWRFAAFWGALFLVVGFTEEFVFRGYTQYTLAQGIGFWPSALLFSLIFGGIHLGNPGEAWIGAVAAALIGLFFCFTLWRTGSLWFAVGLHGAWDWGESYLYSVPDSGGMVPGHLMRPSFHGSRWLTGGTVGPEGSVLVFVVIAVFFVAFDRAYREVKFGKTSAAPLSPTARLPLP
ncbi:MAG TPA: type II CAAX endopeptidase family protein [Bryobacteraceae bacterium]|nr:type II CAAX endopeptidase family protein [Bryobacteraceae bacterium]